MSQGHCKSKSDLGYILMGIEPQDPSGLTFKQWSGGLIKKIRKSKKRQHYCVAAEFAQVSLLPSSPKALLGLQQWGVLWDTVSE